jgi:hypothetical protein
VFECGWNCIGIVLELWIVGIVFGIVSCVGIVMELWIVFELWIVQEGIVNCPRVANCAGIVNCELCKNCELWVVELCELSQFQFPTLLQTLWLFIIVAHCEFMTTHKWNLSKLT